MRSNPLRCLQDYQARVAVAQGAVRSKSRVVVPYRKCPTLSTKGTAEGVCVCKCRQPVVPYRTCSILSTNDGTAVCVCV